MTFHHASGHWYTQNEDVETVLEARHLTQQAKRLYSSAPKVLLYVLSSGLYSRTRSVPTDSGAARPYPARRYHNRENQRLYLVARRRR